MRYFILLFSFTALSCTDEKTTPEEFSYAMETTDGTISCTFGNLNYRVFYPVGFDGETHVIHVSRGGNGLNDDRSQLMTYVQGYVSQGYVVIQVDHRFAGSDVPAIAQYRGEEIKCIAAAVTNGIINYGAFEGVVLNTVQGFTGHSGGCMEGLEAAGTVMNHGNYAVDEIRAVYGISPAGYAPDQFGIETSPAGYSAIGETAVMVIIGEEEKDVNGTGTFMATDWRLQPFAAMTSDGPRFQAFIKGANTDHMDVSGDNASLGQFNLDNSLAFFETYLKGKNKVGQIGTLSLPSGNTVELSSKGL
jgi:hypothetical protein